MEIVALHRRGWSVSAIARHVGCDRKTVRVRLRSEREGERVRAPGPLEALRAYVEQRFADDPHLDATVLLRELRPLGFDRSYPTLTRELRRLGLRPVCEACKRGGPRVTIELEHPAGEELQLDWLELDETPWGEPASVLVGALAHSGRIRGVVSDGMDFPHLAAAADRVLRRLGGTTRRWRTDRMSTLVPPGSDRLRAEAAELAKHYGVVIDLCPPRRAQRKGTVENAIGYVERSWWRTAAVTTPAEAQASLDRWAVEVADQRRRGPITVAEKAAAEPLMPLPPLPFPAELRAERVVSGSALVAFEGNRYSVPAALAGQTVTVTVRLGEPMLRIVSGTGVLVATHPRLTAGAGALTRAAEHQAQLEHAVLAAFTTRKPCRRKPNRPPSAAAVKLAAAVNPGVAVEPEQRTLAGYAELAEAS